MDDSDGTTETSNTVGMLIERWWEDHFPGSAIARDTAAWNIAHAAKETLKRLLLRAQSLPESPPLTKAGAKAGDENLQGSI